MCIPMLTAYNTAASPYLFTNKACRLVSIARNIIFDATVVHLKIRSRGSVSWNDGYDYHWNVYVHGYPFWIMKSAIGNVVQQLRTSMDASALEPSLKYWIKCVTIRPFYFKFIFSTRLLYGGDFATDCTCGVWCHGLTTCPFILVFFLKISFKRWSSLNLK